MPLIDTQAFFSVVSGDHRVSRVLQEPSYERADEEIVLDDQDRFALHIGVFCQHFLRRESTFSGGESIAPPPLPNIIGHTLVPDLFKSAHFPNN